MNDRNRDTLTVETGAAVSLYVIVSVATVIFGALGVLIVVRQPGQWQFLALVVAIAGILFACLRFLRLEVSPAGITYRNIFGNSFVQFAEIERAFYQVNLPDNPINREKPVAQVKFLLQAKNGKAKKLNIRVFPLKPVAVLFSALESRKIPIEVPPFRAALRMDEEIRKCQAKIEGTKPAAG